MNFNYPPSLSMAQLPTPIQKLEKLSKTLEGPTLYVKRDDLTEMAMSGNKIRKLEFLLADAVEKKCDVLITCGGQQSNHARTTAVMAAKLGMKCHLVLRNSVGGALDGNLFLDRLFGAEIQFITPEEYEKVDILMAEMADGYKNKGHRPYVIPEGGSNELGTMGYFKAAEELAQQLSKMKLPIHHVVLAVGSGGTYAGLLLGKFYYDLPFNIYGINVCDDAHFFVNKIYDLVKSSNKLFDLNLTVSKNDIKIIDGYVGKGYALSRQEELEVIKKVARMEGLILDPVYTGKAMFGLIDQIRQGKFKAGENILFIHTGGIFGLFPKRQLFF